MPDAAAGQMVYLMQEQEKRTTQLQASQDLAATLAPNAEVCFSDFLCLYVQRLRKSTFWAQCSMKTATNIFRYTQFISKN